MLGRRLAPVIPYVGKAERRLTDGTDRQHGLSKAWESPRDRRTQCVRRKGVK